MTTMIMSIYQQGAGNSHAGFCGNQRLITASVDPVKCRTPNKSHFPIFCLVIKPSECAIPNTLVASPFPEEIIIMVESTCEGCPCDDVARVDLLPLRPSNPIGRCAIPHALVASPPPEEVNLIKQNATRRGCPGGVVGRIDHLPLRPTYSIAGHAVPHAFV